MAQLHEGGETCCVACYGANASQISFREGAKIFVGGARRSVGENLFWRIEKVHDLSHTSTGNANVCSYFRHAEGVVGIKHVSPFQGKLNGISGGLNLNLFCVLATIQLGKIIDRTWDRIDNERTCAPSGKGDGHNGGRQ